MFRFFLIAVLSVLIAPGTWLRSPPVKADFSQILSVTKLSIPDVDLGEATLEGAWHLESPNSHFGSYSALLLLPGAELFAASDTGKVLRLPMPGAKGKIEIDRFAGRTVLKKVLIDIESLARDPVSGRIWVGFEGTNTIERFEGDLSESVDIQPAAMRRWASNSGPESMVRLGNGHFVVISEGREKYWDTDYPALLFEGDPIEEPGVRNFSFEPPSGYRPVDAAQLPDGRVLVLVREFVLGVPPTFNVKLVLADPREIKTNEVWRGREIANISDPALEDNYEGLTIAPQGDGLLDLWLISDDNNTSFQRTLLLKLSWDPGSVTDGPTEKAREKLARPSELSH